VIKSFASKETEKIFHGRFSSKLPQAIQRIAAVKLEMLHAATVLETLRVPPANYLEELKRERKGQHSIRINKQWRICFTWKGSDVYDVEIVDYH
jgi:proteic killer suppression protein